MLSSLLSLKTIANIIIIGILSVVIFFVFFFFFFFWGGGGFVVFCFFFFFLILFLLFLPYNGFSCLVFVIIAFRFLTLWRIRKIIEESL